MMLHAYSKSTGFYFALITALMMLVTSVRAQDHPYRIAEGSAKPGCGRKLGSTSAVDVDRAGNIWAFERCGGRDCTDSNLAPVLKFDPAGRLLAAFGAGLFVFPHGMHVDR